MTTFILKFLNSGSGKIINNIIWLFLDKGIKMVLGLVIGVWIARYLGPEQFGKLNYGQAFIAIFSAFVNLGLDTTLVKEFVTKDHPDNHLLGTGFIMRFLGALAAVILALSTSYLLDYNQDQTSFFVIAILSFSFIFQSIDVIDLYLQAHLKSRISVILKNSAYVLTSLFKIYLLINNYSVFFFALATIIDLCLASIFLLVYTNNRFVTDIKEWTWETAIAKSLLRASWPLIISALTVILYMRIDQIMIKNLLGSSEVGKYSAAVRITELFFIIPMVITNSVFPSLVRSKNDNYLYKQKLIKLYGILIYISLLLSMSIVVFSSPIISLLYGQQYEGAASVLNIHVWSSLFVFIGVASSQQLVIEGKSTVSLYRTMIGLITNIILNTILIPLFGIQGAAFATLVSYATSSFISNFLFHSTKGITKLYLKGIFVIRREN
ncbi:flippase [Pontibacter locisalis]|uniref:Flippase n=1 Tax=Pontibacter locisalis TaxID=1719035 RepID=A0ABW5II48_9BACT